LETQAQQRTQRVPPQSPPSIQTIPGYVETAPIHPFSSDENFDFDADETISSDYEAVD